MQPNATNLVIDYESHPGFRPYAQGPSPNEPRIDEIFRALDEKLQIFVRAPHSAKAGAFFSTEIQPLTRELHGITKKAMSPAATFYGTTLKAIDNLEASLFQELEYLAQQKRYRPKRGISESSKQVARELSAKGIALRNLDQAAIATIWEALEGDRQELLQKRSGKPKGMASCAKPLELRGAYWKITKRLLQSSGIWDSVNEHCRYPMDADYCALHLSHKYEDWYQGCYQDVGLPTSQAAYMHYDQDFSMVKVILYLQPVSHHQGPFSLLPGDHYWNGSYTHTAFMKELDFTTREAIPAEAKYQTTYYRQVFRFPEFRREFLRLPRQLQGSSHFGDDILDGTPLSQHLLAQEFVMTSEAYNCAVFTGGKHIHRGGMVPDQDRWAFQVGFRMRDRSLKGLKKRSLRRVKDGIPEPVRRMLNFVRGRGFSPT